MADFIDATLHFGLMGRLATLQLAGVPVLRLCVCVLLMGASSHAWDMKDKAAEWRKKREETKTLEMPPAQL